MPWSYLHPNFYANAYDLLNTYDCAVHTSKCLRIRTCFFCRLQPNRVYQGACASYRRQNNYTWSQTLIDTKTTSLNHHRGRHRIVRGALSLGAFRYDFCCYFSQVACERLDYGYVVLSDRHTSATLHSLTYPDRKRETERQLVRALRASTFQCIFPIRL